MGADMFLGLVQLIGASLAGVVSAEYGWPTLLVTIPSLCWVLKKLTDTDSVEWDLEDLYARTAVYSAIMAAIMHFTL
jgi:hypothetical protein